MRKRWNQSSLVGLLCAGCSTSTDASPSLLDGLDDFLCCPFRDNDLLLRIRRLLYRTSRAAAPSRVKAFKERFQLESLVGESESFFRVIEKVPLLASSDATVLISGETGTGKELFARAIHYHSPRHGKPFIPVNCGALPDHLFENEIFGHAKGAFTDAASAEKGLIAEAEGGTLFLDEVDTLSPSAQVKLLRFLQDQEYRPLGSSKSVVADVRVVAAGNVDLARRVQATLFREDLYYRLNVLSLGLPPLRQRANDIPALAGFFLTRYAKRYNRALRFTSGALQKLMVYHWPGNVRELEGVIQRAVVLTTSSSLHAGDFDLPLPGETQLSRVRSLHEAKSFAIGQFERAYLTDLLASHKGNVTRAAKAAGKDRRTFQRLLRKYALERRSFRNLI